MAAKAEEFEPTTEWAPDQAFDTLLVFLPGFKKDHLTVQVTSNRKVRVMGERQNVDKWSRFRTEVPIPPNLDTNKVSARFDNGILFVKFPKEPQPKPAITTPEAQEPASEPQSQKKDQQQPQADATPKVEKPDKPKQGDITPKTSEDKKKGKEGSPQEMIKEETEKPDKGKKPDMKKADDSPSERKKAPVKKPRSSKGQEGGKTDSGYYEDFIGGFLARIKQPWNFMNSTVAVLLVLMLAVYLKHAFKPSRGRQSFDLPNPQD